MKPKDLKLPALDWDLIWCLLWDSPLFSWEDHTPELSSASVRFLWACRLLWCCPVWLKIVPQGYIQTDASTRFRSWQLQSWAPSIHRPRWSVHLLMIWALTWSQMLLYLGYMNLTWRYLEFFVGDVSGVGLNEDEGQIRQRKHNKFINPTYLIL